MTGWGGAELSGYVCFFMSSYFKVLSLGAHRCHPSVGGTISHFEYIQQRLEVFIRECSTCERCPCSFLNTHRLLRYEEYRLLISYRTKKIREGVKKNRLFRGHIPYQEKKSTFFRQNYTYSACPEKPFLIKTIFLYCHL